MTTEEPKPNTVRVTVKEINQLISEGYPLTCATCTHFHESRIKKAPNCGKSQCGGPLLGRDFPDYKGQFSREKLASVCLMCGDSILSVLILPHGSSSRFGLCSNHEKLYDDMSLSSPEAIQFPVVKIPLK